MATLQNFGVPLGGGMGRGGILQPKTKHKFRVRVFNFGPIAGGIELSQQVVAVGKPTVQHNPIAVHSYNSIAYYQGKHEWQPIDLRVRDDVTNAVSTLIGHQEQKQINHFEQTSPLAGSNYKFEMFIETLDGGNDAVLEQWHLEGCFLADIRWGDYEYQSADPVEIQMQVRYDNATQQGGLMPLVPQLLTGVLI